MIARSKDWAFLNRVINDPSVFPHVNLGLEGPFDLKPLVLDERNYFLATEHGGFLIIGQGDGIYDVHTQFLPEGRGRHALEAATEAARFMFTQTDCVLLSTFVKHGNFAAKRLARAAGFEFLTQGHVFGNEGDVLTMSIKNWARNL